MYKYFGFLLVFIGAGVFGQKLILSDSVRFSGVSGLFSDDYRNLYIYKDKDLSFTKYDSVGKQLGKIRLTVPYRIQEIQNPLNIVLFSENAQEIKFLDQNLNETEALRFADRFGFVSAAYAEDQQQVWLFDDSSKKLIQYDFRQDKIQNSYSLGTVSGKITDMLVYEKKLYLLKNTGLTVYDFNGNLLSEIPIAEPLKIRREGSDFYIFTKNKVVHLSNLKDSKIVFEGAENSIVDKNHSAYFELNAGKLYLYNLQKPGN